MRLLVPAIVLMALASCSSSEGGATLPPVTGIVIPAESITRSRGCGTEPGRVYKYVAIVNSPGSSAPVSTDGGPSDGGSSDGGSSGPGSSDGGSPRDGSGSRGLARGVYDCFVNATFTELPRSAEGSAPYELEVVALDLPQYEAQRSVVDALADQGAILDLLAFDKLSGVLFHCDATFRLDVTSTAACRSVGTR